MIGKKKDKNGDNKCVRVGFVTLPLSPQNCLKHGPLELKVSMHTCAQFNNQFKHESNPKLESVCVIKGKAAGNGNISHILDKYRIRH
jgi:hypothetical protein